MGNAGRRLKMPSIIFMIDIIQKRRRYGSYICIKESLWDLKIRYILINIKDIKKLTPGPARAIFNSVFGSLGISSMDETPPKRKSVILWIFVPCFLAM